MSMTLENPINVVMMPLNKHLFQDKTVHSVGLMFSPKK